MAHGSSCHCMVCTVGKKMGMISKEQQHDHNNDHHDASNHSTHSHNEKGSCDCESQKS